MYNNRELTESSLEQLSDKYFMKHNAVESSYFDKVNLEMDWRMFYADFEKIVSILPWEDGDVNYNHLVVLFKKIMSAIRTEVEYLGSSFAETTLLPVAMLTILKDKKIDIYYIIQEEARLFDCLVNFVKIRLNDFNYFRLEVAQLYHVDENKLLDTINLLMVANVYDRRHTKIRKIIKRQTSSSQTHKGGLFKRLFRLRKVKKTENKHSHEQNWL